MFEVIFPGIIIYVILYAIADFLLLEKVWSWYWGQVLISIERDIKNSTEQ